MRVPGVDALREALGALSLDTRGRKDTLRKRLRNAKSLQSSRLEVDPATPKSGSPSHQDFDSYLVIDFEATCQRWEPHHGEFFGFPNEIIEFPVVLLQWRKDVLHNSSNSDSNDSDSDASSVQTSSSSSAVRTPDEGEVKPNQDEHDNEYTLEVVDEYRQFVKPTWRPQLSSFCTELTGITQKDVDAADTFPGVLNDFACTFMAKYQLFTPGNRTVWVTDGPWDLRDFVAKQCYISRVARPAWLGGKYIDLRSTAGAYFQRNDPSRTSANPADQLASLAKRNLANPNIPAVLAALGLPPFQGRQHSGIDDVRNIARILQELASYERGWRIIANARVPGKEQRWKWMDASGRVKWEHPPEL